MGFWVADGVPAKFGLARNAVGRTRTSASSFQFDCTMNLRGVASTAHDGFTSTFAATRTSRNLLGEIYGIKVNSNPV